jgi:hypothetical protein
MRNFEKILHGFFSNLIIGNPKNLVTVQGLENFKWWLIPIFNHHPTNHDHWTVIKISWLPMIYFGKGGMEYVLKFFSSSFMSQPHFGLSVRVKPTLPKVGTWSPLGLPKIQSSSWRAKTPRIGVFLVSLKRSWSVDV